MMVQQGKLGNKRIPRHQWALMGVKRCYPPGMSSRITGVKLELRNGVLIADRTIIVELEDSDPFLAEIWTAVRDMKEARDRFEAGIAREEGL